MHEVSIVNSIIKTLEIEFEPQKLDQLKSIHLKVGILSNIEPKLLHNAYDAICMTNARYHDVKLAIESTELKIHCDLCNTVSQVKQYRFICDNCGNPCKNVIQGEELLIHKVEFSD